MKVTLEPKLYIDVELNDERLKDISNRDIHLINRVKVDADGIEEYDMVEDRNLLYMARKDCSIVDGRPSNIIAMDAHATFAESFAKSNRFFGKDIEFDFKTIMNNSYVSESKVFNQGTKYESVLVIFTFINSEQQPSHLVLEVFPNITNYIKLVDFRFYDYYMYRSETANERLADTMIGDAVEVS